MTERYEALVKWSWQRKTEVLGEKPVPVPLHPPHIPHGQQWDQIPTKISGFTQASAMTGQWLYYHTPFQEQLWSDVLPHLVKLSLQILTNKWRWGGIWSHKSHTKFYKNHFTSLMLRKQQQYYDFWRKKMFEQNHIKYCSENNSEMQQLRFILRKCFHSTCFRWQSHPSSGVHVLYMATVYG